ncbi:MAG: sensor histidine kinase, partial [Sphingobacteriales bacterium]
MKLWAHYNKASTIITISVLFAGALIYFFAINYIAQQQLNRDLTEEFEEVQDYVKLNGQLPKQVDFDEDQTTFIKTGQTSLKTRYFDAPYVDPKEKRTEAGRAITGLILLKGQHYITTITISREGTEYLIQIIGAITLALMVGLLIILFITNRYILNGLWRPFYDTLNALKTFNISDSNPFHLKSDKVDEFNELNKVVETMSLRVKNDYVNLKHFTENASHEMLTPLAVITAKLDTLIQDETLKPEQFEQINDIYSAAGKLSRLNQSLLLLVKIENNLVDDAEELSLDELINQKTRQFSELAQSKDILVSARLEEKQIKASRYLIDILLNNLFSNAIRHNTQNGRLVITLTADKLVFQNAGAEKPLDAGTLFERFQKGQKSEGTGLGLTIVKNICNLYQWDIC